MARSSDTALNEGSRNVTDDLPSELPVTEAEVDLLADHLLDIVTAMIHHD